MNYAFSVLKRLMRAFMGKGTKQPQRLAAVTYGV